MLKGDPGLSPYTAAMPRTLTRERPKFGKLLTELRKEAGLSQYELAGLVGVPQSNIAYWELSDKPPRSEIIPKLAKVLGVAPETFLHGEETRRRRIGPVGKTNRAFEEVSKLPRRQQEKIVEIVSALVTQYKHAHGADNGDET